MNANERKCPYCAEIIKNEALKCKHCGSSLKVSVMADFFNNKKNSVKKRYWFLCIAILVAMFLTNPDKTDFNYEMVKRIQDSDKANNTKPIGKITAGFKSLAISAMTVRNNYIFFSVFKTDNSLLRIIDPKIPKLKFLGIFGEIIPLFSTDTKLSEAKEKINTSAEVKIKEVEKLNDACRGGSGDDPSTFKACDKRDKGIIELKKMGWCYGDDSQAEYEKKWQKCNDLKSIKKNYSNYSEKKNIFAKARVSRAN